MYTIYHGTLIKCNKASFFTWLFYCLISYISYWKERFSKIFFETVIPSVVVESTNTKYYLLSTLIKEDLELRHKLQLEHVLKVQQFERTDTSYMRSCLFCRLNFEGKRREFLHHLSEQHNIQLGNADNLVFIGELLDVIEEKMNNLMCIYCEKTFTDRAVLKEHMRKKLHKRINPRNKCYDKYFVVNYLEVGKGWQEIEREDDRLPVVCGSYGICFRQSIRNCHIKVMHLSKCHIPFIQLSNCHIEVIQLSSVTDT